MFNMEKEKAILYPLQATAEARVPTENEDGSVYLTNNEGNLWLD